MILEINIGLLGAVAIIASLLNFNLGGKDLRLNSAREGCGPLSGVLLYRDFFQLGN